MIKFSRKQLRIPYLVFLLVFVVLPLFVILYYALTNGTGLCDFACDANVD